MAVCILMLKYISLKTMIMNMNRNTVRSSTQHTAHHAKCAQVTKVSYFDLSNSKLLLNFAAIFTILRLYRLEKLDMSLCRYFLTVAMLTLYPKNLFLFQNKNVGAS